MLVVSSKRLSNNGVSELLLLASSSAVASRAASVHRLAFDDSRWLMELGLKWRFVVQLQHQQQNNCSRRWPFLNRIPRRAPLRRGETGLVREHSHPFGQVKSRWPLQRSADNNDDFFESDFLISDCVARRPRLDSDDQRVQRLVLTPPPRQVLRGRKKRGNKLLQKLRNNNRRDDAAD